MRLLAQATIRMLSGCCVSTLPISCFALQTEAERKQRLVREPSSPMLRGASPSRGMSDMSMGYDDESDSSSDLEMETGRNGRYCGAGDSHRYVQQGALFSLSEDEAPHDRGPLRTLRAGVPRPGNLPGVFEMPGIPEGQR